MNHVRYVEMAEMDDDGVADVDGTENEGGRKV